MNQPPPPKWALIGKKTPHILQYFYQLGELKQEQGKLYLTSSDKKSFASLFLWFSQYEIGRSIFAFVAQAIAFTKRLISKSTSDEQQKLHFQISRLKFWWQRLTNIPYLDIDHCSFPFLSLPLSLSLFLTHSLKASSSFSFMPKKIPRPMQKIHLPATINRKKPNPVFIGKESMMSGFNLSKKIFNRKHRQKVLGSRYQSDYLE